MVITQKSNLFFFLFCHYSQSGVRLECHGVWILFIALTVFIVELPKCNSTFGRTLSVPRRDDYFDESNTIEVISRKTSSYFFFFNLFIKNHLVHLVL